MNARFSPPAGFASHHEGRCVLLARESRIGFLRDLGLADPSTWQALLARPAGGPGRGGTVRWALPDGTCAVFKKMRRGGLVGPLWRDRFPGWRRLVANLVIPMEAARRGVPTATPLALLVREGPLGLYEGWLGVEEISRAVDLLTRLAQEPTPGEEELGAVVERVRGMHDAGVDHRDLNLGNLLVRPVESGGWEAFIVDLDRAVLHQGPLPLSRRRSALRRMERSYVKRFGASGPLGGDGGGLWYELYAGRDEALARKLEAGRRADRAWLALHRLGWRR